MMDHAALDLEQDKDDWLRHLAAEVVAMLTTAREEAWAVLRMAVEMLKIAPDRIAEPPQIGGDV
jgi:hypothetical protein